MRFSASVWILLAAGCLGDGGYRPDPVADDPDAGSDAGREVPVCPDYPDGPYGTEVGDVFPADLSLDGNAPGDGVWDPEDFWCMAAQSETAPTVLVLKLHNMECTVCLLQSGPELQRWWEVYGTRGLVPYGVSINDTLEGATEYWMGEGHTHPWAADPLFRTATFFAGPIVATPSYVVVDLSTMRIVEKSEGYTDQEERLFEPYLR